MGTSTDGKLSVMRSSATLDVFYQDSSAGGWDIEQNFERSFATSVSTLPGGFIPGRMYNVTSITDLTAAVAAQICNFNTVTARNLLSYGSLNCSLLSGTASPTAGAGITAALGSLYSRNNSGTGELWLKTGSGDTQWTLK